MAERVQKVLSQWGIASRRKAETMIVAGRVFVNGQTAKLGDKIDLTNDVLQVDGKVIRQSHRPELVYLLLNKPVGIVSTCKDPQNRPTIMELLSTNLRRGKGIHPVGRLDIASSGALILTNDGEFTLGLTHPRYHLPKTYLVELDRVIKSQDLERWCRGVFLDGKKTLPAQVKLVKGDYSKGTLCDRQSKTIEIILKEGRNRQIRRVAELLGYRVMSLHRQAIGSITLELAANKQLAPGKYRNLNSTEIDFLKNSFNSKN